MHAKTIHLGVDAGLWTAMKHNVAIDGSGIDQPIRALCRPIVLGRPKERTSCVRRVRGHRQIFLEQPLRSGVNGDEPDFIALALDAKVRHALTALDVADAQPA
jgi:hypothetical protein